MTTDVVIGLGASIGDRLRQLRLAIRLLDTTPGVDVVATSRVWRTTPIGHARGIFFNAAVGVSTTLQPRGLLVRCKAIEKRMGRRQGLRWGDRSIDLDILFFGRWQCCEADMVIPHPEMMNRPFAWVPACEVAPGWIDPRTEQCLLDVPHGPLNMVAIDRLCGCSLADSDLSKY